MRVCVLGLAVLPIALSACDGGDSPGGLGNGDGAEARRDAGAPGPGMDLGSPDRPPDRPPVRPPVPPMTDGGPPAPDLGTPDRGSGLTRLCNANCDAVACTVPGGEAETFCREQCGRNPIPGANGSPECARAAEAFAVCLEGFECDELAPGNCTEEQESFATACFDIPPPPPPPDDLPPEVEAFCQATCELTTRCIFPVPGCQDACLTGFGAREVDGPACRLALEAAAGCLEDAECPNPQEGGQPCAVQIGLAQLACQ